MSMADVHALSASERGVQLAGKDNLIAQLTADLRVAELTGQLAQARMLASQARAQTQDAFAAAKKQHVDLVKALGERYACDLATTTYSPDTGEILR